MRALTEMQAPLEELRELVEEAEGLPASMPEVEQIQVHALGAGCRWEELQGCCVPLEKRKA